MNKDGPKLACLKELRLQVILGLRKIKQTNLGRHLKEECKNINWMIKFIILKYNFKISHIGTHFLRASFSHAIFIPRIELHLLKMNLGSHVKGGRVL